MKSAKRIGTFLSMVILCVTLLAVSAFATQSDATVTDKDLNDFCEMVNATINVWDSAWEYDFETMSVSEIIDEAIISTPYFYFGFYEYFGFEPYESMEDSQNKFAGYALKFDTDGVHWILKNVFGREPDYSASNQHYYNNGKLCVRDPLGIGDGIEYASTSLIRSKSLDNDRYEITVSSKIKYYDETEELTREFRFIVSRNMEENCWRIFSCADATGDVSEIQCEGTFRNGVNWTFEDGVLTISGSGEVGGKYFDEEAMLYFSEVPPAEWKDVETVILENGVTGICSCAFQGCARLSYVEIPDSVIIIEADAFVDCTGLTSVTIPNSVTNIERLAFSGCSSLNSISIAQDNAFYCDVDGVVFNKKKTTLLFAPQGISGKYTVPDGVTEIESNAFSSCSKLTSVKISNSVTFIGSSAFRGCSSLTSITIPSGVTEIDAYMFKDCGSLTRITVAEDSKCFCSINGVVFNKEKTKLIVVPAGLQGKYSIPDSVSSIGGSAFLGCAGITSVVIPDGVSSIGRCAFSDCTGLTSITIPNGVNIIDLEAFCRCSSLTSVTIQKSVTSIVDMAFAQCNSLKDVYYTGDEADWAKIEIEENNDALTGATIHYNAEVEKEPVQILPDGFLNWGGLINGSGESGGEETENTTTAVSTEVEETVAKENAGTDNATDDVEAAKDGLLWIWVSAGAAAAVLAVAVLLMVKKRRAV